jgi:DNA-binding GntR family transcriptional regulator
MAPRSLPVPEGGPVLRSAPDQVALYIQRLIFDGELKPGERVPQDLIAESLGVSRTPVREALIGLEREGWVTIELNRGTVINAFDEAAIVDHYALDGLLYGFAVATAMERAPLEELSAQLLEIAMDVRRARHAHEIWPLSVRFHTLIIDTARSRPAQTVANALARLVPGNFFELVPGTLALERRSLESIARLVAAGDPAGATNAYRDHARALGALVLDLFEKRGLIVDGAARARIGAS